MSRRQRAVVRRTSRTGEGGDVVWGPWPLGAGRPRVEVPLDMYVGAREVVIRAMVAGVRAHELGLIIGDDYLDICVEYDGRSCAPEECYVIREMPRGPVTRTVPLPEGIDPLQLHVEFDLGLLIIRIPFHQAQPTESAQGAASEC